jgi:hypothetical protein
MRTVSLSSLVTLYRYVCAGHNGEAESSDDTGTAHAGSTPVTDVCAPRRRNEGRRCVQAT